MTRAAVSGRAFHYNPRMSSARPAPLPSPLPLVAVLALAAFSACAHQEVEVLRVDNDWIRPRIEEAARSALRCIRYEPDRVIEFEAAADGTVRAFVEPSPAVPVEIACADEEAARLHLPASAGGLRVIIDGHGGFIEPQSPRARGLALRSRAVAQIAPIEACRVELERQKPGTSGRIGLVVTVAKGSGNAVVTTAAIAASTLDAATSACVEKAAGGLVLPAIPGAYRFSYFFDPHGILVGASDVSPLDPYDLGLSLSDVRVATDACVKQYRTPGRVLLAYTLGNDGVPISVALERVAEGTVQEPEDLRADACLKKAAAQLRVLPFDGPPVKTTVPITLR